jgi:hypothetical protein
MTREPDFRELVGDDLPADEEPRLRRAHDLLLEAGPMPELPPGLAHPAIEGARGERPLFVLPRRRAGAALALAAAIALVAFLGGYLVGYSKNDETAASFSGVKSVTLHGTSRDPEAVAVIRIGRKDANDNVPMLVTVRGLRALPSSGYYTLALTKNGKPVVTCGTFRVSAGSGSTTVRLSVAYEVAQFDGWVVTEYRHGREAEPTVLTS